MSGADSRPILFSAMPLVGSNISIDLHIAGDVEISTIRSAVQKSGRLRPSLAEDLRAAIEQTVRAVLERADADDCAVTVDLSLNKDRIPGALRQRVEARLNVEGERSALAAVDDALGAPERARIANAAEARLGEYLRAQDLADVVGATVIVTPVQFR